jgi:hypothetical protein
MRKVRSSDTDDDDRRTIKVTTTEHTVVYRALSLGAGAQSSVLALLLSRADSRLLELGYPKPDVAVFADTGWEPEYVYDHLAWLETELSYPLIRVSAGDLKENLKKARTPTGYSFVDVPLFTVGPDGKKGMLRRQCTNHYKIRPIYRKVKALAGGTPGRPFPRNTHAEMWIGISLDEVSRMKPSSAQWVRHRWPLVDLGMTRSDCLGWFQEAYPNRHLPRSVCVICPYRSDAHWRELQELEPTSYEEAIEFDRWLRKSTKTPLRTLLTGRPYLHATRRPLASAIRESEPVNSDLPGDHYANECDGLCGV